MTMQDFPLMALERIRYPSSPAAFSLASIPRVLIVEEADGVPIKILPFLISETKGTDDFNNPGRAMDNSSLITWRVGEFPFSCTAVIFCLYPARVAASDTGLYRNQSS